MKQKWWQDLQCSGGDDERTSYRSFLILPCRIVSDLRICFCLKPLFPLQLSKCPGCHCRLCSAQHSPLLWASGKPHSLASAHLHWACFSDTVFRDVAHLLFFFYCRLLYNVCILVQHYKCFSWFENKKKNPLILSKISQINVVPASPHQEPPQGDPQPTLVRAHVKDSSYVGAVFTCSIKVFSGKGAGSASGVFPFTDKVTWFAAVSGRWHLVAVRPSQ